jgi:hypothetical protein
LFQSARDLILIMLGVDMVVVTNCALLYEMRIGVMSGCRWMKGGKKWSRSRLVLLC